MNKKRIAILLVCMAISVVSFCQGYVVIDKTALKLTFYDAEGKPAHSFPIAVGSNFGDKTVMGDCKTPEGEFPIKSIEASIDYHYDFGDGRGLVKGAYGPRFIRLLVPGNNSIGIHGSLPEHQYTIPGRVSHGCIRMKNKDILKLCKYVRRGMKVIITPDLPIKSIIM